MNNLGAPIETWTFPHCPVPPSWTLDWPAIQECFAWVRAMSGCPQNPIFHAEGDVLIHTRMVVEALVASKMWRGLDMQDRSILFAAALLHDVAKPACTIVDDDGSVTSRGHARRGARLARTILYMGGGIMESPPIGAREAIVNLVLHHGLPLWVLDDPDPQRSVIRASIRVRCDWLAIIAEADARGRNCPDGAELLERIALFSVVCQENQCADKPYPFASDVSRFLYFRTTPRDPTYHAFDETRSTGVMLAGLPASGKDHWIHTHQPNCPVVSLDALRISLKIAPDDDQGQVIAAARESARLYLRDGRSFVWNATNTTRALRERLIDMFAAYGARVRLVYLEAPFPVLIQRNCSRPRRVPENVLRRLATHLDVPDLTEAHHVEWVVDA